MKRTLSFILALIILALTAVGCADKTPSANEQGKTAEGEDNTVSAVQTTDDAEQPADNTTDNTVDNSADNGQPQQTVSDESGIPPLVKPWESAPLNGGYISEAAEAIVTVAESYLARKMWLQYECTNIYETLPGTSRVRRTQQYLNTPEDCTSQNIGYTMCSFFAYDVLYQAFGIDMKTSSGFAGATDMQVFHYTITGKETDLEKRRIEQRFLDTLQQGDIIVNKHRVSSGHVLIYIGDGMIIDSAYFGSQGGGNYDLSANKDLIEKNGSVRYREVMSFFETDNYYYFWGEKLWAIVRPSLKYELNITEQTQNRVKNLKNIYVEKLSSHTVGQSVDIGEEITFTINIRNDRDSAATLQVEADVPQYTEFVSGAQAPTDGKLMWEVTVEPGKQQSVVYTVRVLDDPALYGKYISGEGSTVGGVNVRCRDMYIGKHLSSQQTVSIRTSLHNTSQITERYMDMAKIIYNNAGLELNLPETGELLDSLFVKSPASDKHYILNQDSPYYDMIVPTMYGGYYCCEEYDIGRTADVYGCKLYTGDILVAREGDNLYAYIFVEDNKVLSLKTGNTLYALKGRDQLLTLIGRDVFAVLRPSMAQ